MPVTTRSYDVAPGDGVQRNIGVSVVTVPFGWVPTGAAGAEVVFTVIDLNALQPLTPAALRARTNQ